MKTPQRFVLSFVAPALAALAAPSAASAQIYVGGSAQVGYAPPPPVVVQQPVVYQQPAPVVYQQPQPVVYQQPAVYQYRHNLGLMFRLGIGVGYGSFGTTLGGTDYRVGGLGVNYTAAIGWGMSENFAVHLDLNGMSLISPGVTSGTGSSSTTTIATGQSYNTGILGGGFTYYSMPMNVFVTGSVGLALLSVDANTSSGSSTTVGQSRLGFGASAQVGKEWFFGNGWGVGGSLMVLYALIPDQEFAGTTPIWHNVGVGLNATLTGF